MHIGKPYDISMLTSMNDSSIKQTISFPD